MFQNNLLSSNGDNHIEESSMVFSGQTKRFIEFIETIKEKHKVIKPQHTKTILQSIRPKVPLMKKIEELQALYEKCFAKPKKQRRRINPLNATEKYEKWKFYLINLFVWTICEYSYINRINPEAYKKNDWEFIASLFPQTNAEKCQLKWFYMQKSYAQKGAWNQEEDYLLAKIIKKHQDRFPNSKRFKWNQMASELNQCQIGKRIRLGKHCRERWLNHLNPNISKKEWTVEEDVLLLESIRDIGKKWSKISKMFKGRHENSVKNRFISIIRAIKKFEDNLNLNDIEAVLAFFKKNNSELHFSVKKQKNEPLPFDEEKTENFLLNKDKKLETSENEIQLPKGNEDIFHPNIPLEDDKTQCQSTLKVKNENISLIPPHWPLSFPNINMTPNLNFTQNSLDSLLKPSNFNAFSQYENNNSNPFWNQAFQQKFNDPSVNNNNNNMALENNMLYSLFQNNLTNDTCMRNNRNNDLFLRGAYNSPFSNNIFFPYGINYFDFF